MCGIAGIMGYPGHEHLTSGIGAMTDVLRHRGPDGEGYYVDGHVALGHRRLSIIDLTESGDQPLCNEDDSLVLVFNGEIYNHKALSAGLKRRGHRFRGASDGEVILHLYEEEGFDCLRHLDGMFAFALYDKAKRLLFIARDRIGEKPLYYMETGQGFYFSSELKSFLNLPGVKLDLSDRAILNYFLHTQVPAPYSVYEQVSKLIPGHYLVLREGGELLRQPYWRIDYRHKRREDIAATTEELRNYLARAVIKCMVSDVPVGVALSGGIDSSAILALACMSGPQPSKTFTLGRSADYGPDPEFNRAERIAAQYGTDHYTYHFKDTGFEILERALAKFDEPVGIPDIVYTVPFNAFVAGHVKVALTGNGADEIFGGYQLYTRLRRNTFLPQAALSFLPRKRQLIDWLTVRRLNQKNREQARLLFCDEMTRRADQYDVREYLQYYFQMAEYDELFDARLFLDLLVTLNHSAGLADTTGMASSLELRSPFLDHHLVEFSATLPVSHKVRSFCDPTRNKYVLKQACQNLMPSDMIFIDKLRCGQFIDLFKAMKTNWRPQIEALLSSYSDGISHIFSRKKLIVLWNAFLQGQPSADPFLMMKIVIFLAWHRTNVAQG